MSSLESFVYSKFKANSDCEAKLLCKELCHLYGENFVSYSTIQRLLKAFRSGNLSSLQNPSSRLPKIPLRSHPEYQLPDPEEEAKKKAEKEEWDSRWVNDNVDFEWDEWQQTLQKKEEEEAMQMSDSEDSDYQVEDGISKMGDNSSSSDSDNSASDNEDSNLNSDEETELDDDYAPTCKEIFSKLTKEQRRILILNYSMKDYSVNKTVKKLKARFGTASFDRKTVALWFKRFRLGEYSCKERPHPVKATRMSDEQLKAYVEENPYSTTVDIAQNFKYSTSQICRRFRKMGWVLKRDKWVPYRLNDAQKKKRVDMCKQLLDKMNKEPEFPR